jgi:hypothetical protein
VSTSLLDGRDPGTRPASDLLLPLAFSYVVTVSMWAAFVQFDWSASKAIGLFNLAFCAFQLVRSAFSPFAGPLVLTFWPFVSIWIAFASLIQLGVGKMYWPDSGLEYLFPWAQLLFTGAIVAYSIGTWFGRQKEDGSGRGDAVLERRAPRLWPLLAVGFLLVPVVLATTGGLAGRFTTREGVGAELAEAGLDGNTLTLFFLNRLPPAIAIVAAYTAARQISLARSKAGPMPLAHGIALLAAFTLIVLLANPFSNPRFIALSAVVGLLFGFMRVASTRSRAFIVLGTSLGMLFIYPLSTFFKKTTTQANLDAVGVDTFTGIDFDGYQTTINAMSYVQERGISWGEHIIAAFAYFVPRAIWEGKPVPASIDVSAARGYVFQNLSLPLWGEFYLDLGAIGMVVAMFLYGWFSSRLDRSYSRDGDSLGAHLAVLFAVGQFALIRGPLGASVVFSATVMLIGLATFALRDRPQRSSIGRPKAVWITERSRA